MPVLNLSKEDLKLVKRFQSCVSRRKRIPDALYKKITLSTTLPKSIKALAKKYQTLVQSGGTIEDCWTHDNKVNADLCTLPSMSSMTILGEGANGIVFNAGEENYVWKQSNAVSDIDAYIEQLQQNFSVLNTGLEDPIYISLFKAHPHKDRSSTLSVNRVVLQGFAYKMKKFNPFAETPQLIDNIKALCGAVDRHHSTGLVHFDAKLDNVLVDTEPKCTLVDVDGSLSFSKILDESVLQQLQQRSKFHAITPLFAHPLILAIFHGTNTLNEISSTGFWEEITWLLNICIVDRRNFEILGIINHQHFHTGVFDVDILSLREKPLLNLLKYTDYYSLLVSYYMHVVIKIKRHIENLEYKIETSNTETKEQLKENKTKAESNLEKIKNCFINALRSKARAYGLIDPPAAQGGHCGIKRPRNIQSLAANKEQRRAMPNSIYWNQTTLDALNKISTQSESDIEYVTIGLDGNIFVKPDTSCENSLVPEDGEFPYKENSLEWKE